MPPELDPEKSETLLVTFVVLLTIGLGFGLALALAAAV